MEFGEELIGLVGEFVRKRLHDAHILTHPIIISERCQPPFAASLGQSRAHEKRV